jgi:ElaB/YqjD/DUF883 family membrane-anchored ribosome-binding protein
VTIIETIKRHPVPAALTGIGLAWLWMNRERQPGMHGPRYQGQRAYPGGQGGYGQGMYGGSSTWDQGWRGTAGVRSQGAASTWDQPWSGSPAGDRNAAGTASSGQGAVGETIDRAKDTTGMIVDQAQETVGHAADRMQSAARTAGSTAGDVGSTFVEAIRQNPMPAALAGLSLAWLWVNRPDPAVRTLYAPAYSASSFSAKRDESMMQRAQDTAGQFAGRAQETAGQFAGQAQEAVGYATEQAQHQALRARYRFEEIFHENPLIVGTAALVLGALVGLPLPQTPQEHRLMGEARDTLVERTQEVAQETIGKVQQVAETVRDTAQEEARSQGLMQ